MAVNPSAAADANIVIIGRWSGSTTDSAGSANSVWTLHQNGTVLSGTAHVADTTRDLSGTGTIRGAVNGKSIRFRMEVPTGAFVGTMAACSMAIDGGGTISDDGNTFTGTYTGSLAGIMTPPRSCGGTLSRGTFSMNR